MLCATPAVLILHVAAFIIAAPVDNPIRVDLPVYDSPNTNSDDNEAISSEPRNDQIPDAGGLLAQKIGLATNVLSNKLNAVAHAKSGALSFGGAFSNPVTTLEGAILETEAFGSRQLSMKENVQNFVAGLFRPKPLLDTIREEEKYGNNGDKFDAAGKAIVDGAHGVSNLINTVLEIPSTIFKKIARTTTEKLNNLGGRIVGLYNK